MIKFVAEGSDGVNGALIYMSLQADGKPNQNSAYIRKGMKMYLNELPSGGAHARFFTLV